MIRKMRHRMNAATHGAALRCALMSLLVITIISNASAQSEQPVSGAMPTPTLTVEEIGAKRAELQPELEAAKKAVEAGSEGGAKPAESITRTQELLQQLDLVISQQSSALDRATELGRLQADVDAKLAALQASGLPEQLPKTFIQLDHLRDELNAHTAKKDTLDASAKSSESNFERAKRTLEEREQSRRQAREVSTANKDPEKAGQLTTALRLISLQCRVAEEQVALRRLEMANEKTAGTLYETEHVYLNEQVAQLEKQAQFNNSDRDEQQEEIDKKVVDLKDKLDRNQRNQAYYDNQLFSAKQRLEGEPSPTAELTAEVEARRLAREARQTEANLIAHQLERLARLRQIWDRRYQIAWRSTDVKILPKWLKECVDALKGLDRDEKVVTGKIADLRKDLLTVESKIEGLKNGDARTMFLLREQQQELNYYIGVYEAELASVHSQRRMEQKLLVEIEGRTNVLSIGDRLAIVWDKVKAIWVIELYTTVDDKQITVGKVISCVALIVIGLIFSKLFSSLLGKRILPRFGLNQGAATVMQTVVFYSMVALSVLLALNLVRVPLTAFTVLGGAIAIGVGFGAQNIINNFISGWILIAERPVRIGDLVELDGVTGHVKSVGARCTRIRRSDGIDLLVPNSLMLERTVVNWTLSDIDIRTSVVVGTIYGSPTDQVARLIMRVVSRNKRVLDHPKPILIFSDFGDNALIFEVFFWVHATAEMDLRIAKSEIRFEIDRVFRAAGLVIAFPQRDVHVDSVSPIEVRMVRTPPPVKAPRFDQQASRLSLLKEIDLLHALDDSELEGLARSISEHQIAPEQAIVRQGDQGNSLFILVSGLLEVAVEEKGVTRPVGQVIPGEFFGEMSLLTGQTRAATVTTVTESHVFEVQKDDLADLLKQRPKMVESLGQAVAMRQRRNAAGKPGEKKNAAEEKSFVDDIRRRINSFFGLH